jgi:tRNA pseudouridine55 synthase
LRKLQETFSAGNWYQFLIPAAEALAEWSAVELNPDEVEEVKHGHRVKAAPDTQPGLVRGVSLAGELIAIMDLVSGEDGTPEWQPKKVFFS